MPKVRKPESPHSSVNIEILRTVMSGALWRHWGWEGRMIWRNLENSSFPHGVVTGIVSENTVLSF